MAPVTASDNPTITETVTRRGPRVRGAEMALAGIVSALCVAAMVRGEAPIASALGIVGMTPAAIVDACSGRLPNAAISVAAALFVAAAVGGAVVVPGGYDLPSTAVGALTGAGAMAGPLLALHVVSPASLGFGDVKASLVLGAAVGVADWRLALVALALAAGGAVLDGVVRRRRTVCLGPWLVIAAALAIAVPSWPVEGTH